MSVPPKSSCYLERGVRPRRVDNASRIALVFLSKIVVWRDLLTIVQPDTFGRWRRTRFSCSGEGSHAAPDAGQFQPTFNV